MAHPSESTFSWPEWWELRAHPSHVDGLPLSLRVQRDAFMGALQRLTGAGHAFVLPMGALSESPAAPRDGDSAAAPSLMDERIVSRSPEMRKTALRAAREEGFAAGVAAERARIVAALWIRELDRAADDLEAGRL